MLTINRLIQEKENVILGLQKKGFKEPEKVVDDIIEYETLRKKYQGQIDALKFEISNLSKKIYQEKDSEESIILKAEVAQNKQKLQLLENQLKEVDGWIFNNLVKLPNIPAENVPSGTSSNQNEIVLVWGDKPDLLFKIPHWDIIKKYDIVDFDLGNKVSGAGFPFYKGKGARLQRALINYFLDKACEFGYREIQTPILVNRESAFATGQLPDKDDQMYHVGLDDLYLIPTAEVSLTNIYRDSIVSEDDLPIKLVGYTPCFRREAGSWGSHVRGLNRLHQFDKVEIVQIVEPYDSYRVLEEMSVYVQSILKDLGLHYRVLKLCSGDMSFSSALTYDMEVWSAAQERWLEVSSVSNFETFQSNRLKLRYKSNGDKKSKLLHTLNGSALALPRIMAAILENNQDENGIKIPEVLVSYTGFTHIK